jgi:signal transduction histidine kinase
MSVPSSDARSTDRPENRVPGIEAPFRVPPTWESWAVALGASCAVFGITFAIQWFIYHDLLGQTEFHAVGVSVASVLTFIFIQRMMAASRRRRLETLRRFQIIAEMNHHIRNSLQAILYQSFSVDDAAAARLKDAVDRIQWVLEEVLPAVHDGYRGTTPDDDKPDERAA